MKIYDNERISDCCNAKVYSEESKDGTAYYVCDNCKDPCNAIWKKETNPNGVSYDYILNKLLLELPDLTPKEVDCLLEFMSDHNLLSEEGEKIKSMLYNNVWKK